MTAPPYEVLADDTALLTFDGWVLELFGYGDAHRLRVWQQPRLDFGTGRKLRMQIMTGQPGVPRHSMPYDPGRLDALRAFAAHLARGVAGRLRL